MPEPLPFTRWGLDFIQDLPETANGHRHILTAICHTTKFSLARAVRDRTAATVALFIYEEIICRFGSPVEIITDRASCFQSGVLAAYLLEGRLGRISLRLSSYMSNVIARTPRPWFLEYIRADSKRGSADELDVKVKRSIDALHDSIG